MAATNNIIIEEEEVRWWVPDPDNRVVVVGLEEKNKEDYWSKHILPRVCRICGKSFGSGKALGGHMRIHNHHDDRVVAKEEPIICLLCRKGFPSMKSLYGHMRCHPDRDWRGIKPPDASDKLTFNENKGGGAVDLKECLTSWQITARRGRKPRIEFSRSAPSSIMDDKHDHEAVKYLMMLAHGKYHAEFGLGCTSNPIRARAEDQELGKRRFDLNELPTSEGEAINRWVSKT